MSDWQKLRIGDFANTYAGGTPARGNQLFFGGNIPWVKSTEVNQGKIFNTEETITETGLSSSSAKWIPANTVLVALYGATAAQIGFLKFKATSNQAVLAIIPTSQIDSYYLYYSLLSAKEKLLFLAQGSGQPNLNKQIVDNLKLDIPPLPQQRKIAKILTTVDNLIEKTESLIAKYHSIKQGMMHDLFTRGVDANGKLRPPQSEAPELYKQSELGWIPKDWSKQFITELFEKRTEKGRSGLKIMSIVMSGGLVERTSLDRRVDSNLPPEGHALVLKDDIAYNMMRMWQGVFGLALSDCLVSPAYVVLKPKSVIASRFAAQLFSQKKSILKFRQRSQGVVDDRLRLYFKDLKKILFDIPNSLSEQEKILLKIDSITSLIFNEKILVEKYKTMKTALMQDLLTGKVQVTPDEIDKEIAHA